MASGDLPLHHVTSVVVRSNQVAINTMDSGLNMDQVGGILSLVLVTAGAESTRIVGRVWFLCVNLVTVGASHSSFGMLARRPLSIGAGVTHPTQVLGSGDCHAFFWVLGPVGSVTRLAGHARQHELPGSAIVTSGVTRETFTRLCHLLQGELKDRVEGSLGMRGVRPCLEFTCVAFAATVRALIIIGKQEQIDATCMIRSSALRRQQ